MGKPEIISRGIEIGYGGVKVLGRKNFHCIMKFGHVGSGKYVDKAFCIQAESLMEAYEKAKSKKGVKKGRMQLNGESVIFICEAAPVINPGQEGEQGAKGAI
jgi:hypothetical protein